ncbi:MAG: Nitrogen regulatory protein P-II [Firmicutes bacterium ADurb.Bin193]|nr:MAG: Nitrogen regulatory protein P-II [Firmicutes bacterium ADurb.Bin193]
MTMQDNLGQNEFSLLCAIVNFGLGSKIIKTAKQHGVLGGTTFLGRGTIRGRLVELLELCDIRKEIVIMIAEKHIAYEAAKALTEKYSFHKPHHGVAFITPVRKVVGARKCHCSDTSEKRGAINIMYKAIFTIVDKGNAETVIEAATAAGSRGGTIINARGSGIHETGKLFSMDIEPEKEIVLILSDTENTESITAAIGKALDIDKPGNGIIFVQDIENAFGLY